MHPGQVGDEVSTGVLRACGLQKSYGDLHAVKSVSFEVQPGQVYGLLGPNGAGKTTTLSMIVGVLEPDHGHVEIAGRQGIRGSDGRPLVGYVPQDVALYPDLTARENIVFFAMLAGLSRREAAREADWALEVVDLLGRANDRVSRLSGGMARRVNIAAGLVHHPKVLTLDEPTVGVDPQSRRFILESIRNLADSDVAVLFSSHYIAEVEQLCDVVGIIDHGQVVAEGPVRQLVQQSGGHAVIRVTTEGPSDELAEALVALPGVENVVADAPNQLAITADDPSVVVPQLFSLASNLAVALGGLEVGGRDLESAFIAVTGRSLRE